MTTVRSPQEAITSAELGGHVRAAPGELRRYGAPGHPRGVARWGGWVVRYPRLMWEYRDLVWNLTRRELLGRFRGSLLGALWILAQPLFLFAVYYVIFGIVFMPRAASPTSTPPDTSFATYLFAGVVAWGALSETLSRTCTAVTDNASLVKYAAFPSEILAVPLMLAELAVYAAGVVVLIAVGVASGSVVLSPAMLGLPLVLVVHVVFTMGIGLALAALQVFVRDTVHAYGVLSVAWLFASPVFWRIDTLTHGPLGRAATLLTYNPAYPLLQAHRAALGVQGDAAGLFWYHLGAAAAWSVLFMTLGYAVFVRQKHQFADLV